MYKVILSSSAEKTYRQLFKRDLALFQRFRQVLLRLQHEPFQGKPLKGRWEGKRSLRVGSYRIIYEVIQKSLIVYVLDIGHRREVYRS